MGFETSSPTSSSRAIRRQDTGGSETFYAILARRAKTHPDRVAIVDRDRRVTYVS